MEGCFALNKNYDTTKLNFEYEISAEIRKERVPTRDTIKQPKIINPVASYKIKSIFKCMYY